MKFLAPIALVAALVLSGCTAPEPDVDQPDYVGSCPAWSQGPGSDRVTQVWHENSTRNNGTDQLGGSTPPTRNGHGLDRFVLNFESVTVVDARVTGRVLRADTNEVLLVRDFRFGPGDQVVGSLVFTNGMYENVTVFVDLAGLDEFTKPSGIRIEWSVTRDLDGDLTTDSAAGVVYEATPWYRVCGLP